MEVVDEQLKLQIAQETKGIKYDFVEHTRNIGGLLVMDVGPRGGGKTTKAVEVVNIYKNTEPTVRRVSNVPIEGAYYVPNILKFLATKLIAEGGEKPYAFNRDGTVRIVPRKTVPAKMLVIVDETAISGLEARGSGMYSLNTYLLALSRKLNVDIELISQLMSMVDKRGQWLSDFYTLCEQMRELGYFRYRNYNAEFRKTTTQKIWFDYAQRELFPKFDTTDIPNYDELSLAFKSQYQITDDDMSLYQDIKAGRPHMPAATVTAKPVETFILERKSLLAPRGRYPGETILMVEADGSNKRYEVMQKDFMPEHSKYRYRLREIPELLAQQQSIEEGGLDPITEEQEGGPA